MIASMTGYGKAEAPFGDVMVSVDIRSVNHRFCEVTARVPKSLTGFEPRFRQRIQQRVTRGRVEMMVAMGADHRSKHLVVDTDLARQYYSELVALKRNLGLSGEIDVGLVATAREVVTFTEPPMESTGLAEHVEALMDRALDGMDTMRRAEGDAIARDLEQRLGHILESLEAVERRAPMIVQEYAARLQSRVKTLTKGVELDAGRLAQEVALQAERGDYTEETTRLRSHLAQCRQMLKNGGAVGRPLDFLLQEMNREVNTIGSKAGDAEVAMTVVTLKSELEKFREQVQNIE